MQEHLIHGGGGSCLSACRCVAVPGSVRKVRLGGRTCRACSGQRRASSRSKILKADAAGNVVLGCLWWMHKSLLDFCGTWRRLLSCLLCLLHKNERLCAVTQSKPVPRAIDNGHVTLLTRDIRLVSGAARAEQRVTGSRHWLLIQRPRVPAMASNAGNGD